MEIKGEDRVKVKVNSKDYQCEKCDKVFKHQYLLKRHSVVHTGERKFVCSVCGKTFKLRSTLSQHEITHLDKKQFACSLCSQQFSRPSTLKTHMEIHAKSKKFLCEVCGKYFTQKGNLASHMNVHLNNRPFKCKICDCTFNQGSNLRQHMLSTHPVGKDGKPTKSTTSKKEVNRRDHKKSRTRRKSNITEHNNRLLEYCEQISESLLGQQSIDQNITSPEDTPLLRTNETSPLLSVVEEDPPQSCSLRFLQSNDSYRILVLVNDVTGEITLPVIQNNQVLQLMINSCDLDSLLDCQQVASDPTNLTFPPTISNLSLDEILSEERFDPQTIQNDPSLMFSDGFEWYNNMCTD